MNHLTSPWNRHGSVLYKTSIPANRCPAVASIHCLNGVWEWSCFIWHSSFCVHQQEGLGSSEEEAKQRCDAALVSLGYRLTSDKVAVMF